MEFSHLCASNATLESVDNMSQMHIAKFNQQEAELVVSYNTSTKIETFAP